MISPDIYILSIKKSKILQLVVQLFVCLYKKSLKQKNIMKKQQFQQRIVQEKHEDNPSEDESSAYSSEDQNAYLLTEKVQQKILETVARLKSRDPSIYKVEKPIFQDDDFQEQQEVTNAKQSQKNKKGQKYTYKDMLNKGVDEEQDDDDQQLPPAMEEKRAKNKFKQALEKQKKKKGAESEQNDGELFTVKGKLKKQVKPQGQQPFDKYSQLMHKMKPQTQKLIKSVWQNEQKMDQTDLFLKEYILSKKWLMKKAQNAAKSPEQAQKIDQQDEQRSVEMDQYEAKYNFRYEQPQGDKIVQYPRKIQESLRLKSDTRKQKRKKVQERKKQEEKQYREQAEKKKQELRENILSKLQEKQMQENQEMDQENQDDGGLGHDWFFCDDCGKAFQEDETNYQCEQCQDYMLCQDCFDLIIHKHPLVQSFVPEGFGAPKQNVSAKILSKLQPCKTCRRKLPMTATRYEYKDRSQNVQLMCQRCYDESPLDMKKKFSLVEAKINRNNIEQILQKDPTKVKQLTNSKQIEQMVDQYLKYEFQDVIGGGFKTKFKYLNVKPQSYGLSDQQILFGDDKQLNKYVSVKKLVPYRETDMRLRNNIYKKKVVTIDRSVKYNKKLIETEGLQRRLKKTRFIDKLKRRSEVMKNKRQTKLRVLNLSNPEREKKIFVPTSRLASYGVTLEQKPFQPNKHHQDKKQQNNQHRK